MTLFNRDERGGEGLSATELLRADHAKLKGLFEEFASARDESSRASIANMALKEILIHDALEEDIFYPALREVMAESEKVDLAGEEHRAAKLVIADLGQLEPGHPRYAARFKVLSEIIKRHIEAEERDLLPAIERSGTDLEALGRRLQERKEELMERGVDRRAVARSRRGVRRAGGRRAPRRTVSRR